MFVWTPNGYVLREPEGDPPEPGSVVEVDERREQVTKIGPLAPPGDDRACVYLQG